jgi:hypothetical protein
LAIENWYRVIIAADMAGRQSDFATWELIENVARQRMKDSD